MMSNIIGTVYKTRGRKGRRVINVPYKVLDEPCFEGCCENDTIIGIGTLSRTEWLLEKHMLENDISEFDFSKWNDLEEIWEETRNNLIK